MRFCLCIFESYIVKSDCPVQIFRKMIKYLKIQNRLLVCLICLDIKKKTLKMTQSTGHFQSFLFIFFRPPDPKSGKKNPVNQLIKNAGLILCHCAVEIKKYNGRQQLGNLDAFHDSRVHHFGVMVDVTPNTSSFVRDEYFHDCPCSPFWRHGRRNAQ